MQHWPELLFAEACNQDPSVVFICGVMEVVMGSTWHTWYLCNIAPSGPTPRILENN